MWVGGGVDQGWVGTVLPKVLLRWMPSRLSPLVVAAVSAAAAAADDDDDDDGGGGGGSGDDNDDDDNENDDNYDDDDHAFLGLRGTAPPDTTRTPPQCSRSQRCSCTWPDSDRLNSSSQSPYTALQSSKIDSARKWGTTMTSAQRKAREQQCGKPVKRHAGVWGRRPGV